MSKIKFSPFITRLLLPRSPWKGMPKRLWRGSSFILPQGSPRAKFLWKMIVPKVQAEFLK